MANDRRPGRAPGDYDQNSRGGSGYGRDSRGSSGYDRDARGGSGYGRDSRGGSGYGRDSRGGSGYDRDSRGGSGYGGDSRGGLGAGRGPGSGSSREFENDKVRTRGRRPGGRDDERFNLRLLITCLIGGALGTAIGLFLIGQLYREIPNLVLFSMIAGVIGLFVLLGAMTTSGMYNENIAKSIIIALAGSAILLAAGGLFEYIYELRFTIKKSESIEQQQKEVSLTDYIFCIDDSISMNGNGGNDPNHLRDTALEDLLAKIDSSSQVGLIRFESSVKANEIVYPALLDQAQKDLLLKKIHDHDDGGGTNFDRPITEALRMYSAIDEKGRSPVIVLLTDGDGDLDTAKRIEECKAQNVTVCAIFLSRSEEVPEGLKELTDGTGGTVKKVENAEDLIDTYTTVVEETATSRLGVATDPDYTRFLAGPRRGADTINILAIIERILFFGLFGTIMGVCIRLMLGEMLKRQILTGTACGLIAGAVMEFGYLIGLGDFSRIGLVLYGVVLANYIAFERNEERDWGDGFGRGGRGGGGVGADPSRIGRERDRERHIGGRIN